MAELALGGVKVLALGSERVSSSQGPLLSHVTLSVELMLIADLELRPEVVLSCEVA